MFRYFKFKLNDTVQFTENDGHMYRIVGYQLEKGFYQKMNGLISFMNYLEFDGYTMDAEEEELVKVVQVEDEYYKIQESIRLSLSSKNETKTTSDENRKDGRFIRCLQ